MLLVANTNVNEVKRQRRAENLNNAITIGVFLVAILNILISALGIKNSDDLQEAIRAAVEAAAGVANEWKESAFHLFLHRNSFFNNILPTLDICFSLACVTQPYSI